MDQLTKEFLNEVDRYCDAVGIKPSTLGDRAVNDSKLFARIVAKKTTTFAMAARVRRYMANNPPLNIGKADGHGPRGKGFKPRASPANPETPAAAAPGVGRLPVVARDTGAAA